MKEKKADYLFMVEQATKAPSDIIHSHGCSASAKIALKYIRITGKHCMW